MYCPGQYQISAAMNSASEVKSSVLIDGRSNNAFRYLERTRYHSRHSGEGREEDDDLPTLKQLLLDAGKAHEWLRMGSSGPVTERCEGKFKYAAKNDCGKDTSPESSRDESNGGYVSSASH